MAAKNTKEDTAPSDVDDVQDEAEDESPSSAIDYSNPDRTAITFRETVFTIPADRSKWPTRAMQAFQKRLNADGVEQLLGPQQWDRFNQIAPLMEDFWEFFPIFAEAAGFVKQD